MRQYARPSIWRKLKNEYLREKNCKTSFVEPWELCENCQAFVHNLEVKARQDYPSTLVELRIQKEGQGILGGEIWRQEWLLSKNQRVSP
jgi:hypothetical protein